MAANRGAVDHVLPVVCKPQIDQRLEQRIPDALSGPAPEPNINRVPLAITLVHVAPGAANPQHMQHPIEKAPVVTCWSRPPSPLRWQQCPDQFPFRDREWSRMECPQTTILRIVDILAGRLAHSLFPSKPTIGAKFAELGAINSRYPYTGILAAIRRITQPRRSDQLRNVHILTKFPLFSR